MHRRRRPALAVLTDVFAQARTTGHWALVLLLGLAAGAVVLAVLVKAVVPLLIYPAL
jgi:hypothetical protein